MPEVSIGALEVERLDVPGKTGFARDGLQQADRVRDLDPGDRGGFVSVLGILAACGYAKIVTLAAVARVPEMLEPLSLFVLVN